MVVNNVVKYFAAFYKINDKKVVSVLDFAMAWLKLACEPRGGTPYNGLYGEAPPERGTFSGFRYIKG